MSSKTVVVLGAGSFVGIPLFRQLSSYNILAISREAVVLPEVATSRTLSMDALKRLQPDYQLLISLMPIWETARVMPQLKPSKLAKVIALSSSSVFNRQSPEELEFVNQLKQGEDALEAWLRPQGIDLIIFRPALVFGYGRDKNVSLIRQLLQRTRVMPFLGKAEGLRQPLYADDLARAIVLALEAASLNYQRLALGGASCLPYRQMVKEIARAAGLKYLSLQIPRFILKSGLNLLKQARQYQFLDMAMFERMNEDLVVDNKALETLLAFKPMTFANALNLDQERLKG